MNYYQYIKSSAWKRKREAKIRSVQGQCQHCHSRETLQVHHLSYSRVGNEPFNHLMVLCRRCHELIEAHMQAVTGNRPVGSLKGLKNFTHKCLRKYGVPQAGETLQPLNKKAKKLRAKKFNAKLAVAAFRLLRG